jgi:hypothetical protein
LFSHVYKSFLSSQNNNSVFPPLVYPLISEFKKLTSIYTSFSTSYLSYIAPYFVILVLAIYRRANHPHPCCYPRDSPPCRIRSYSPSTTQPFVSDHCHMQLVHTTFDDLLSTLTVAYLNTLRRESSEIVVAPGEVYFRDEYYCPRTGEKQVAITTDLANNVEGPSVRTFRIEFFYDPPP